MSANKYTIIVKSKRVAVSGEVYKAYYREREYARYVHEKARAHELSLEELAESGARSALTSPEAAIDEALVRSELAAALHRAIAALPPSERRLIEEIFFEGKSERSVAEEQGIHYMTIHSRKQKILVKLHKLLEKQK